MVVKMNTEPSVLYQIFDILLQIIVFIVIMGGGYILMVCFYNFFFGRVKKGGSTFLDDLNPAKTFSRIFSKRR